MKLENRYKLMDNPDLDVDTLLDEYFNGVYGAGGKDMKRFYLLVEKTYCSPENYPPYVRDNKNYDHQTEEIAWGWLGTEERMKQLSKFFENAKAAADAGMAKRNVDLFEKSTWSYMLAGRQKYLDSVKSKFTWRIHARRIPFAHAKSIDGDPSKVDWTEALTLSGWRAPYGEPTILDAKVQLLLDEKFLYVRFADLTSASPTAGKRWEIAVSKKREGPGRLLKLNSAGVAGSEYAADGSAVAWDSGAKPSRPAEGKKNYEAEALAIPLDKLGDGLKPEKMFMNFRRVSKNEQDQVVYVPGGETFDSPAVLAEFVFDGPETIPVGIPDTAAWQKTAPESLIGLWKMDKISGETIPDFSGHSLNGRLVNGPALKKGGDRKDSIRLSDELRQSVDIKGSPDLNLKAPFSLSIWICYEPTRTWYPAIMGKGYGNEAEKGGGYSLHLRPDNSVWFELDTEDGERKIYNPTERPVAPGEWTHAAATYDGKIMRVYVNGREAGKGLAAENVVLRRTSQPLRIGWLGSWGWFNGSIRNASIYSRSLSPAEIFAEYLSGK
ncbi:MAG: hypothetical protein JW808_07645 [Victivallales bacterium]|nr:hypothetical protein [Victivallales bacterium]